MATRTADLFDTEGEALASLPLQLRDLGGLRAFSGPLRTVSCHEDNAVLREVVSASGHGAVLVVDGHGSLQRALLGDSMATIAADNGWAGIVLNSAVRDSVALAQILIGIKALGTNPRKSLKEGIGDVDIPVVIAGVRFEPGKFVYCDEDGVLVER